MCYSIILMRSWPSNKRKDVEILLGLGERERSGDDDDPDPEKAPDRAG
jgi:hypothetical protein